MAKAKGHTKKVFAEMKAKFEAREKARKKPRSKKPVAPKRPTKKKG